MRLKKGFTLAEILIVLMVIGVIATMTVPSMMKGVTEAQLKTGYKKAFNTISNFAATERVAGNLPTRGSAEATANLFASLSNTLSVKGYAMQTANAGVALSAATANNYPSQITSTVTNATFTLGTATTGVQAGTFTAQADAATGPANQALAWIITEDNLAYTVVTGGATGTNTTCQTKQQLASQTTEANMRTNACAVVYVDVNGMSKGPNSFETQGLTAAIGNDTTPLATLVGDRYKIYLGSDGATPGHRTRSVTGRIIADVK